MPFYKLYYHFVWHTKDRLPLIQPTFEQDLYRAIAAKVQKLKGSVHAVGGTEDHVHLAAAFHPKIAPALFIGEVKGNASHFINKLVGAEKALYWQDTYGVLTFGEKNLPAVVRYIQRQKQHHANGKLHPLLEISSPV